ncbi:MAG: methyltransferase [Armatimonadota bacterium]|nr:methyltransferase [Armatimonadota bacterium]
MKQADSDSPAEPTHYFVQRPQVPSRPREIAAEVRGQRLSLVTDRGVFSYGKVDSGSRLLAEKMQLPETGELLDWGCAWGLIGIVAARIRPRLQVTMVDVNHRACELARENARRNRVEVEVLCGPAEEVLAGRRFDVIVVNPPISAGRAAVLAMMDWCAEALREGGSFWMVAATKKGAKTLRRELEARYASVQRAAMRGGFRVYCCKKPLAREEDGCDE